MFQARVVWWCVCLALLARVVVTLTSTGADYDIASYQLQAHTVLAHQNVYVATDRYPYLPVWIWVVALAHIAAQVTGLPFVWWVKVPAIAGDCLIVAVLGKYKGRQAALFYALNPVSLLITAGHGQFDGLVLALVVGTWALWKANRWRWAALLLGGAIALKSYPILFLPALLLSLRNRRHQMGAFCLTGIPVLVSVLLYSLLFGFESQMIARVVGYAGTHDFGWSLYLRLLAPAFSLPEWIAFLLRLVVLLLPVYVALHRPGWAMEQQWLLVVLGFYSLSPGISAQYLLWVVPIWALGERLRVGWWYSVMATAALICFYLSGFSGVIPGSGRMPGLKPAYLLLNAAWWLTCIVLARRSRASWTPAREPFLS